MSFAPTCGYHRKAALRRLPRPLPPAPPKRSGPKLLYAPGQVSPVLKAGWLASDQLCSKLLKAALPEWLAHQERRSAPRPAAFKKKLLAISPAQIDRHLRPARGPHPKKGLSATRPGSVEADTVAHCDDSTEGDYVHSLTFTELFSGWIENRAVWNKSAEAGLVQLQALEQVVPYVMKDFHTDNGGEFLNWAPPRHLTGRAVKRPWTRRRAYRKNDNAHCEQKNWTHGRQRFGHDRFEHPALVALMNDLYASEWRQFTNHFKPTFKRLKRETQNGKTKRVYAPTPQTPDQRLLASPDIPEATKTKLRAEHAGLDPFALKKNIEVKLRKFFTALGNLNREATKP